VVARHREHRRPERAKQVRGALELLSAPTVCEVARGDDELGLQPLYELRERLFHVPLLVCARVQVGNMEEPHVHNRTRL
jgi:hypothetical protein